MSDAGPPSKSYEQPRRYEIPERFRPAPRPGHEQRRGRRGAAGPTPDRASAPTQPVAPPSIEPGSPSGQEAPAGGHGVPRGPGAPVGPVGAGGPGAGTRGPGDPGGSGRPRVPGGPGRTGARGGPGGPGGPGRPGGPGVAAGARRPDDRRPGRATGRISTRVVILAIAAIVVVVGAALGAYLALSGGGTSDTTAARQAADKLYTALNGHDAAALKSLSCNPLAAPLGAIPGTLSSVQQAASTSGQKLTGGDSAASTGTMVVADPAGRRSTVTFQLQLHKQGSDWCYASMTPSKSEPVASGTSSAGASSTGPTTAPASSGAPVALPPSPTAYNPGVCARLTSVEAVDLLITNPVAARAMPDTFVPPQRGTNIAVCRALFRPERAGHVASVAVYVGTGMQQYVAQLKSLRWQLVGRSATSPQFENGLGVKITIVQSGAQLVLLHDSDH